MIPEDPQTGAPYFIKRLVGSAGDTLQIEPPLLYINGEPAKGFGFQRVMQATSLPIALLPLAGQYLASPDQSFTRSTLKLLCHGKKQLLQLRQSLLGPVAGGEPGWAWALPASLV